MADSRRPLDAVLLLDKAVGMTSNAALQSARRLFNAPKAGHAGTLDPLASGLLVVLFGEATKFADHALTADKEYEAEVQLGIATDTGDADGAVVAREPVLPWAEALPEVLKRFLGAIEQVPPMHSAIKQRGRPLYVLARKGLSVERKPRQVRIEALEALQLGDDRLRLRVRCSKGTYIRTLAEDLGRALGTVAHLAALRRTAAGPWRVEEAATLDALADRDEPGRLQALRPLEALLQDLPRALLDGALAQRFRNGQTVPHAGAGEGACAVYGPDGRLIGLGESGDGQIRPRRLVAASGLDHASG